MTGTTSSSRKFYSAFGESKTAFGWEKDPRCQVGHHAFLKRLKAGWSVEKALTEPPATKGSKYGNEGQELVAFGETKSMNAWASDPRCKVSRTMLRKRVAQGMPLEEAMQAEGTHFPTFGTREAFGEEKTLAEWSRDDRCVVAYQTIQFRLSAGWSLEDALSTRLAEPTLYVEVDGVSKPISEWTKDERVTLSASMIRARIRSGMSPEEAIFDGVKEWPTYTAWGEEKGLSAWARDPRSKVKESATLLSRIRAGAPLEEALTMDVKKMSSFMEDTVAKYVQGLGCEIIRRDRRIIGPKELDIVVPEKKIAIEFNGVKWHTERYVGKNYHFEKSRLATEKGYTLIHLWEDDWMQRRPVVQAMLAAKLGKWTGPRVYGRQTEVAFETDVADFLDTNHIQGFVGSTCHVGLRWKDEQVAVASFQKGQNWGDWVLSRYATSIQVVGGFTKCLKFFIRNTHVRQVKTFADRSISGGNLYIQAGFVPGPDLPPDYSYVIDDQRVHKFNYRIARFKSDPDLIYEDGLTERELAELNGLERLWDAGKTTWIWKNPASE